MKSLQEMYSKISGVDLFSLKSYMEKTEWGSVNGVYVIINDIFVNIPFFILNLIVGFFSILMQLLESIDLVGTYESSVYKATKSMWTNFMSGKDGFSVVYFLITLSLLYLLYQYLAQPGRFAQKLLHFLAVVTIAFAYFGVVGSTGGGVYVLKGIRDFSKETVSLISSVKVEVNGQSISVDQDFSKTYVADTSYRTYLFVNTGRVDGQFKNNQTGKLEVFDDSKVLGKQDNGVFKGISSKDRLTYLDDLGNKANEGEEKNRWVSAVLDYVPARIFYILFMIVKAFILALPIIFVQLLSLLAQVVVLGLMFLVPLALLLSFVPSFQHVIFGLVKTIMIGSVLPSSISALLLAVFLIERMISIVIAEPAVAILSKMAFLESFSEGFSLLLSVAVSCMVYVGLWKFKGTLINLIFGHQASMAIDTFGNRFNMPSEEMRQNAFEMAQRMGDFTLYSAGLLSGGLVNGIRDYRDDAVDSVKDMAMMKDVTFSMEDESVPADGVTQDLPDNFKQDVMTEKPSFENQESLDYDFESLEFKNDEELQNFDSGTNLKPTYQSFEPSSYEEPQTDFEADSLVLDPYHENDLSIDSPLIQEGEVQFEQDSPIREEEVRFDQNLPIQEELPHEGEQIQYKQEPSFESETTVEKKHRPLTKRQEKRADRLQEQLDVYQNEQSYFEGQGSNSFVRGFNSSRRKEQRIRANMQREESIKKKLKELRGEV